MILKISADASVLPAHHAIVTEIAEMTDAIVIKFDLKRKDIK